MPTNYIKKLKNSRTSRPGAKAGRALGYAVSTLLAFAVASILPTAMIFIDIPPDLIDQAHYAAIGTGLPALLLLFLRKRRVPKFMAKIMERSVTISAILAILSFACLGLYISKYSVPFMAWYTFG